MNKIIERKTVDRLVTDYNKISNILSEGYDLLSDAEAIYKSAYDDEYFSAIPKSGFSSASDAKEKALLELKKYTWITIIKKLGIRKLLSIKKAALLDKQLYNEPDVLPDITLENVYNTLKMWVDNIPEFTQEACLEVFAFLRPHHNTYKTNKTWAIGNKVILERAVKHGYGSNYNTVYYTRDRLAAIEKVMHALDGKGIPDGYYSPLEDAINATPIDVGRGETEYYKFQCYKNGNLHLQFKRMDLVQELNRIGGDGTLPGAEPR